jgi:epoxyqueuosine reductase
MQWMAKDPERRADPRKILPGCQSIICVGINYWTDIRPEEGPGYGRIARYAWGKDYHRLLKKRLKILEQSISELAPESSTRSYVDTGPVMEKIWAQRAGLGWIGKHSNLVSPTFGSWLLLGEVLTTLELEPDEPGTDLCGTCTLCIRACPTQAITEPYIVDATKCISYLTIEYRDDLISIPQELRSQMGNRIFGCDDCLDACPYNVNASPSKDPAFFPTALTQKPNLHQLSQMNEETFAKTFQGSPIRRPKHSGFQRNVQVALSNDTRTVQKAPQAGPQAATKARHTDEYVETSE